MRRIFLFLFLCVRTAFLPAESWGIPDDPRIVSGKLENGLVYYVCPSDFPQEEVSLRLIVKTGSIYEQENERGIAHFVEHMVFRGSRRLQDGEIFKYLESIGAWPGADTNAYTGCETTVYKIDLPTNASSVLRKGLFILDEMAFHATLADKLIDKERTVILDELYQTAAQSGRKFNESIFNLIAEGSAYENRLPGGLEEVVQNCSAETIRRFYKRWYRPDRMAVVAVGDFDAEEVKKAIVDLFSKEVCPEEALPPLPSFEIPEREDPFALIACDPAATGTAITLLYPYTIDLEPVSSQEWDSKSLKSVVSGVLSQVLLQKRIEGLAERYPGLFLYAWAENSAVTEYQRIFQIGAVCFEEKAQEAVETLGREIRRIRKWGFLEEEFLAVKEELIRSLELAIDDPDFRDHASIIDTCSDHFLLGSPLSDERIEDELYLRFLQEAELIDVNCDIIDDSDSDDDSGFLAILRTPSAAAANAFSEESLLALFAKKEELEPYRAEASEEFAFRLDLPSGEVVQEAYDEATGVYAFALSNGAKLFYKQTDLLKNEIVLYGYAQGGYDLIAPEEYPSALFAVPYYFHSGIGNLTYEQMKQYCASRQIHFDFSVEKGRRSLSLFAPLEAFESGLKLVHTAFIERKFDSARWDLLSSRYRETTMHQKNDAKSAFYDFVHGINSQDHYLFAPIDAGQLYEDAAKSAYDRFFADPSPFAFILVGSLGPDEAKQLAGAYLASIPRTEFSGQEAQPPFLYDFPQKAVFEKFYCGGHQGSETLMTFPFDFEKTLSACGYGVSIRAALMVLEKRLETALREERGDTYGVSIHAEYPYYPSRARPLVKIRFTSHSREIEPMVEIVMEEIKRLNTDPPEEEELFSIRELIRSARKGEESNWDWIKDIVSSLDAGRDLSDIRNFEEYLNKITASSLQNAHRSLFSSPHYTVLSHLPDTEALLEKAEESMMGANY